MKTPNKSVSPRLQGDDFVIQRISVRICLMKHEYTSRIAGIGKESMWNVGYLCCTSIIFAWRDLRLLRLSLRKIPSDDALRNRLLGNCSKVSSKLGCILHALRPQVYAVVIIRSRSASFTKAQHGYHSQVPTQRGGSHSQPWNQPQEAPG